MIVIVAGMHRTGTSALAGMLHHNGIMMGHAEDFYPPPMKENPKGFFENVRFRRINDALLNGNGYRVKSFDPDVPVIKTTMIDTRLQMIRLIDQYDSKHAAWGWKDPRTCLTMNVWLGLLEQMGLIGTVAVLVPCRATKDVAASMLRRGNKGTHTQFEDLARTYNKRLLVSLTEYNVQFKTVDFEKFMLKTEFVVSGISKFLGYPITDTTFVDPNISQVA